MKNNILVISSFPEKGIIHGKQTVGGASYTKIMLLGMIEAAKQEQKELSITVLAEELQGQDRSYQDQGMQIHRVWKRNHPISWLKLLHNSLFSQMKNVFISFELAMFGGTASLVFLLLLVVLLRLSGKRITLVGHHVILNLDEVAGHLNTQKGSFTNKIGTVFLKGFYLLIISIINHFVVFDKFLKDKLQSFGKNKIIVIPHGVETVTTTVTREEARKKLEIQPDEFVLVSFGYLAWYKGSDWLVDTVNALSEKIRDKKIRLILAGGANPNRLPFVFYRTYIEKIQSIADKSDGRIQITGYVPQDLIEFYYQAADCLVYPYRAVFSASGPLSLAFSYKKPFLLAESMKKVFKTEDFAQAVQKEGIDMENSIFSLSHESFQKVLQNIIEDKEYKTKLENIASSLASSRSFTAIGKKYFVLID